MDFLHALDLYTVSAATVVVSQSLYPLVLPDPSSQVKRTLTGKADLCGRTQAT